MSDLAKPRRPKITDRDELLRYLEVDCARGLIWWRRGRFAGKLAGGLNAQGYWTVNINYSHHRAHHIIWIVAYGRTASEIDHIDGDRSNNAIANLREVTRTENLRNRGRSVANNSGVIGVNFQSGKWRARIYVDRRAIELGRFDTIDEAIIARRTAEADYGFHPNHGQRVSAYPWC